MEPSINIKIEQFKQNIFQLINQAQLPIGVIKLILSSLLSDVESIYADSLNKEYAVLLDQQQKQQETQIKDEEDNSDK